MTTLGELVETYLLACGIEGKSPNTIKAYAKSLSLLQRYAAELELPDVVEGLGVQDVYRFLGAVQASGASRSYRHRLHVEIRTFFSWCVRLEFIKANPFLKVPAVAREAILIQPFSPEEILALLKVGDQTQRTSLRNRALILFLLDSGVRVSECVQVHLDDVDWEHQRVRILHGKGRKQRWVGIGDQSTAALRRYVEEIRGREAGALFLSTYSRHQMQPFAVNCLLTRLGRLAGVSHVHPHGFRHTFATWALSSNAREIDVQMLLGHSSIVMTQRYARTYSSEQAIRGHRLFSPVQHLSLSEMDAHPSKDLTSALGVPEAIAHPRPALLVS